MTIGNGEHIGWDCVESPEVWFEDIVHVPLSRGRGQITLSAEFVQSCTAGSIRATEAFAPGAIATASVEAGEVVATTWRPRSRPFAKSARIRIQGIRKGYAGGRYKRYSAALAERNEEFYKEAKSPKTTK